MQIPFFWIWAITWQGLKPSTYYPRAKLVIGFVRFFWVKSEGWNTFWMAAGFYPNSLYSCYPFAHTPYILQRRLASCCFRTGNLGLHSIRFQCTSDGNGLDRLLDWQGRHSPKKSGGESMSTQNIPKSREVLDNGPNYKSSDDQSLMASNTDRCEAFCQQFSIRSWDVLAACHWLMLSWCSRDLSEVPVAATLQKFVQRAAKSPWVAQRAKENRRRGEPFDTWSGYSICLREYTCIYIYIDI